MCISTAAAAGDRRATGRPAAARQGLAEAAIGGAQHGAPRADPTDKILAVKRVNIRETSYKSKSHFKRAY
jgi:hypothetical protein